MTEEAIFGANPHADKSAQRGMKICNTNYTNRLMARIKGDLKKQKTIRIFVLFVFQDKNNATLRLRLPYFRNNKFLYGEVLTILLIKGGFV